MTKKRYFENKEKARKAAEKIWTDFMAFAGYAFPRGHATPYALIANACQYLKVHYPTEFFCAHLEHITNDEYLEVKSVAEKFYSVKFMMPDINLSKGKFVIEKNSIVWSLESIKGIGYKAAMAIIEKQPYASFKDFHERVNKRVANIKIMNALIAANAFREFGNRNVIGKELATLRKDNAFKSKNKKQWDFEASKLMPYFKQSVRELFPEETDNAMTFDHFLHLREGKRILIAGIIESLRIIKSKRGMMILMKVVDSPDIFNVVCWSDMYRRLAAKDIKLAEGMAVKVSGFKGKSYLGEQQIALGDEPESYVKVLR